MTRLATLVRDDESDNVFTLPVFPRARAVKSAMGVDMFFLLWAGRGPIGAEQPAMNASSAQRTRRAKSRVQEVRS